METGGEKSACEGLCDRISFISYWCYFVLSGLPFACNGNLGALGRGRTFVQCVHGSTRVHETACLCAQSCCFRQYLYNRPPLQPPTPPSVTVCVYVCPISERFTGRSSQVSLYFSINFSSAASPKCYRGVYSTAIC